MTEEDIDTFHEQMREAKTPDERHRVMMLWGPHIARCMRSTNAHVKAVEEHLKKDSEALRNDIGRIFSRIEELHRKPRFRRGQRVEWLRENWIWCIVLGYIAQSLFGIDVGEIVRHIMGA